MPQQWLTFLSDYGVEDAFLGVCKGVIARTAPDVRVLDVLHLVAPQDVEQGAAVLASAVPYLPVPAVHLALVDPFRASPPRGVAVRTADGSTFVSPDNGLTSLAWAAAGGPVAAYALDDRELWNPLPARTFRGRDVFSPVAARLAAGLAVERVGSPVDVDELERLAVRTADGSTFVSPDNGLTSLAWEAAGGAVAAYALDDRELWNPLPARTFRGRDVFSPVAARLAAGLAVERVGSPVDVDELERLAVRPPTVEEDHVHGEVAQVDHFGNLTLNLERSDLEAAGIALGEDVELRCSGKSLVVPFLETYGQVGRGKLVVCEDAFRTVTVAVNQGSAAQRLRAGRGEPLVISRRRPGPRPVVLPPEPQALVQH